MAGPMNHGPRGVKPGVDHPGKLFTRLMKYVLGKYKFHCLAVLILIFVSVIANVRDANAQPTQLLPPKIMSSRLLTRKM